ncbi:iron donor protein CyaY [Spirabiliibacterium falconis]|uniref:iron donor protein CyaY n=1 Tax=Spirabiliibacterium falconis TaxID=572023 RepID=UPI001AADF97F|nr:iron donor protein CyaY [Spirabiliibacterium falconis]MBE2894639.1 iron donor protein CyaY [Spirabiliibacterium falconis]
MNVSEYHQQIEKIWADIETALEQQEIDVDCDILGSVFSITFADGQQIVINKQEPLLELWLASKLGGYHFKYKNGLWLTADNKEFFALLTDALNAYGEHVTFK